MAKNVIIENGGISLSFSPWSLNFQIFAHGKVWKNQGRGAYISFYKKVGKKYIANLKSFRSAKNKSHKIVEDENGKAIISSYEGFWIYGKKLDISFVTTAHISNDGELTFSITAEKESENYLRSIHWPRAFNSGKGYSVGAYRQGYLIVDKDKKAKFFDKFVMTTFARNVNTGDCYMPLWGRVCNQTGYCAFIDDANDAAVFSSFGKKGAILSAPYYLSSLGKLGYQRKLHIKYFEKCDYNDFAHYYKSFLINQGKFVTLKDKIAKNPNVKKLIGAPIIHTNIFAKIQPESKFYVKDKSETLFATFEQRAEQFERFKQLGLKNAYIHLDGWGNMGYDNLHPYVLPPCPKAGGAEGMKALADKCEQIGYLFGLHDQYRDFYTRSQVYDYDKAVKRIDGSAYFCNIWMGGTHNWLCASFAPQYVERTYKELEQLGINVKGAYLDVFSIVLGDQCFDKNHMQTRTQSIASRGKCFDLLRDKGMIVCSEEPGCLMVDKIDLVHHAPHKLEPQENGRSLGYSIPLFNLVFHECVFVPWGVDGEGGWGIPVGERGELHCILNAQSPYFNGFVGSHMSTEGGMLSDEEIKQRIVKVDRISEIQSRLYDKAMVNHTFLDDNKRVQRTTYSDGTQITVDFDKNTYDIKWAE